MTYKSEEVIIQQGEPATKFYILLEGEVDVFQELPHQPPKLVNHMKRGDYFGEVGLLRGGKRTATVRVAKDLEAKVMVIDEEMFQLFLSSSKLTNTDVVDNLYQRLINNYLSQALPHIDKSKILAAASQAKIIRYGANSTIVQQDTPADKFYMILEGEAKVIVSNASDIRSYQITAGEYFGDAQLVDRQNFPFTVQAGANNDIEVMVIERESFCRLIGVI
nr:cyclic nucleotide-binding domain-containing protein [Richelia sinica]